MSERNGAWKCDGCGITFKGGTRHVAADAGPPAYRYCDNCWCKPEVAVLPTGEQP